MAFIIDKLWNKESGLVCALVLDDRPGVSQYFFSLADNLSLLGPELKSPLDVPVLSIAST
jgi:hypothetical protein